MTLKDDMAVFQRALQQVQASGILDQIRAVEGMIHQMKSAGVFDQIRAAQQALNSMAVPTQQLAKSLIEAERLFARLLGHIQLSDFQEWLSAEEGDAIEVLTSRGWWPHPEWPFRSLRTFSDLKREGQIGQLDNLICASYEANRARPMRQAVDRWMKLPEFKARRRIFQDSLWAYRKGRYGLAVSHLLPQIEGVLRGFAERLGFAQSAWKKVGRDISENQPNYTDSFTEAFLNAWGSLYDSSLPQGQRASRKRRFPVRRHAILHGVDVKFARRAYAMRLFLMLDTMHYLITNYETAERSGA